MTGLETAAVVAVAVWLVILTCGLLLAVRQISLLTVRLSFAAPHVNVDQEALAVGSAISEGVRNLFGEDGDRGTIALLTGTCGNCRELADGVTVEQANDNVVFLVAGEKDLATEVARLLPEPARRIFDPGASRISNDLQITSSPFGISVADGVVTAKTYLQSGADLSALLARANQGTASFDVVSRNGDQHRDQEAVQS